MKLLTPEIFKKYPEIRASLSLIDDSLPGSGSVLGNRAATPVEAAYNRAVLASDLGVDPYHVVAPSIAFTDRVASIDEAMRRLDADAVVTNEAGWLCLTTMADCFPVLAYDPVKKVVGSMHNGWANSKLNLAEKFIEYFVDRYQSNPRDIILWVGPGLAKKSFEVTEEFLSNFDPKYFERQDETRWLFDHRQVVNDQFMAAGVTQIENLDDDTKTDERYFSARRQGQASGRMAAVILLVDLER